MDEVLLYTGTSLMRKRPPPRTTIGTRQRADVGALGGLRGFLQTSWARTSPPRNDVGATALYRADCILECIIGTQC